jgi:hypothetical protein
MIVLKGLRLRENGPIAVPGRSPEACVAQNQDEREELERPTRLLESNSIGDLAND